MSVCIARRNLPASDWGNWAQIAEFRPGLTAASGHQQSLALSDLGHEAAIRLLARTMQQTKYSLLSYDRLMI